MPAEPLAGLASPAVAQGKPADGALARPGTATALMSATPAARVSAASVPVEIPRVLPQPAIEFAIQHAMATPSQARGATAPPQSERPAETPQPVRVQYHLAPDGVAVWLGVDAHVALDPLALAMHLRQALERQGLKLHRLTCNGRPVFDAQARPDHPESPFGETA